MPEDRLTRTFLLPELILDKLHPLAWTRVMLAECHVQREPRGCPKCGVVSDSTYDHRWTTVKDAPFRTQTVRLRIRKRRLWCAECKKPFTENVGGIRRGHRHTERYGRAVLLACERYSDLSRVRRDLRCSAGFLYATYYRHLDLEQRKRRKDWPAVVGLDEHYFRKKTPLAPREFVSMVVDYRGKRLLELVNGRTQAQLESSLEHFAGRENVKLVVLDMCDPFKNFARDFFPNAKCVADKFHVLRLLNPALTRRRIEVTGDRRSLAIRRLLLRSRHKLSVWEKMDVRDFLARYPVLREVYEAKEALHALYRITGIHRAARALDKLLKRLAASELPELQTLRRTLTKWREEVLLYFFTGVTNARTEGFNLKAKLVMRRGYGYRSFRNYRLRLLNACAA